MAANPSPLRDRVFERILLIKLSAMGDVIHALPVLAKLRARYPQARIDWLITAECADLVRRHPALSDAIVFSRRGLGRSRSATTGLIAALARMRRARYELAIDLQGQLRSAAFALASGAPARLGFAVTRERVSWAYTHRIPVRGENHHAVDRNLWLGPVLGLPPGPPEFAIQVPAEAAASADALLARPELAGRPLAVVVPGTAWETKHWGAPGFASVCGHLHASGFGVVVAGAAGDRDRCAAAAAGCPGAVDLCGRTSLMELAALIRASAVCIANDSGPMHLAAALGTPVVAAFGPTNPVRTGPYGRAVAVVRTDVPCSPCYIRTLRRCPYGHRCMVALAPAMMIERIEAVLAGPRRPEPRASAG